MPQDKIRIGFIGAGQNTQLMHIPKLQSIPGVELKEVANIARGSKLRRHHRFIRMIKDTFFPKMKYRNIQQELKKRKEGKKSEIPDAVWQNPSP